jgi:hypothetical protein
MDHTSRRVPSVLGALPAVALLLGSAPGRAQPLFDHLKCVSVQDSPSVKARVDLEARRAEFGLEHSSRTSGRISTLRSGRTSRTLPSKRLVVERAKRKAVRHDWTPLGMTVGQDMRGLK